MQGETFRKPAAGTTEFCHREQHAPSEQLVCGELCFNDSICSRRGYVVMLKVRADVQVFEREEGKRLRARWVDPPELGVVQL